MKLSHILKDDKIEYLRNEAFTDYVPTADELNQEITTAKKAIETYKHQNKQPMVAKFEQRLKQLEAKKAKLS